MDTNQFYPTPADLLKKMWLTFDNKTITRLLDPSAGDGRLLFPPDEFYQQAAEEAEAKGDLRGRFSIYEQAQYFHKDACEIDMEKHAIIRDKRVNIVALDFMNMKEGAIYSHIIMNPPFSHGADHVLHAWDILYEGEIVAVINAETLRNPFSRKREQLLKIIADNAGTVEYLEEAFLAEDTQRKTSVEVALIHLTKTSRATHDFLDTVIDNLQATEAESVEDIRIEQSLAIPTDAIQNAVIAFNAAWAASKEAIILSRRVNHYKRVLGETLAQMNNGRSEEYTPSRTESIQETFAKEYDELKDRGWAYVLRSTEVGKITSRQVQEKLENDFEHIKKLDFTLSNIFGFLQGLALNKGQIQVDMALEVFDSITRYHSENRVYYMGWKSNDQHRTAAMRIKMKRFVLPGFKTESWQRSLNYESLQILRDIDKVCAMLDGETHPYMGLVQAFDYHFNTLKSGKKLSTSYFDIRYYPGIGTIHFFPNKKKIIDRLNIMVGKARKWIPEDMEKASSAFVKQYDDAEKINKNIRISGSDEFALSNEYADRQRREKAIENVLQQLADEMEKLGYDTNMELSDQTASEPESGNPVEPVPESKPTLMITHEISQEDAEAENFELV